MADDDPKVSYRMPAKRLKAIDALADQLGVSRSWLLRQADKMLLAHNLDALKVEAEIGALRDEIIEFGRPIDDAGGFAGRVRRDFERRWKNGYAAKWIAAKAESYRREARMLEEKVADHPDAPEIEPGELVAEVDAVLQDTLDAIRLSDWEDRYPNPFERFEGVQSGIDKRRFVLACLRTAMKMDEDMSSFKSFDRRVRPDDLGDQMDDALPFDLTREDVARVARDLRDRGLTADAIDPENAAAFDPFGLGDLEGGPEIDATTPPAITADGGDNETITGYVEHPPEDTEPDVGDLVEWAANCLNGSHPEGSKERIRAVLEADAEKWQQEIMDTTTLTVDELIELATEYNEAVVAGERPPDAVETESGGVVLV